MPNSNLLKEHLTEEEQRFVEAYYNQASKTFGNGTHSAIEAYGESNYRLPSGAINYNLAGVDAHSLLRRAKIYMAGKALLNTQGFNDEAVEAQHSFLINQSAELNTKAKAVDMYYKLMGKYEKDNQQRQPIVNIEIGYTEDGTEQSDN